MILLRCITWGEPQTAGSKRAFVPLNKRRIAPGFPRGVPFVDKFGRVVVNVTDDNDKAGPWKTMVANTAAMYWGGGLLDEAIGVGFLFMVKRPAGHFSKSPKKLGQLLPSAPPFPAVRPDALKLARAAEDALTGVVWIDDARIVDEFIFERYAPEPGVVVTVWTRPDGTLDQPGPLGNPELGGAGWQSSAAETMTILQPTQPF